MENSKMKIVLFLGAGFSVQSGFPSAGKINEQLLATPTGSSEPSVEEFISETIRKFWGKVFAWKRGMKEPSLEDHFTQIDMAAKSWHNLGPDYDSRNSARYVKSPSIGFGARSRGQKFRSQTTVSWIS
jgi:NAD-dependent SIR2 family protein deacetylase